MTVLFNTAKVAAEYYKITTTPLHLSENIVKQQSTNTKTPYKICGDLVRGLQWKGKTKKDAASTL